MFNREKEDYKKNRTNYVHSLPEQIDRGRVVNPRYFVNGFQKVSEMEIKHCGKSRKNCY